MLQSDTGQAKMWRLVIVVCLGLLAHAQQETFRYGVDKSFIEDCLQMKKDVETSFECEVVKDDTECMKKLAEGSMDVGLLTPSQMYAVNHYYPNKCNVMTEMRHRENDAARYKAVVVVRKEAQIGSLNDLKSKKTCHTGYDRTAGWRIPISKLMHDDIMPQNCNDKMSYPEQEISSVSNFFQSSCVPGMWNENPQVDARLKNKYNNLCSLCHDPKACSRKDEYAGYEGSLKCLTEGNGDVTFTKDKTVIEYFELDKPNPKPEHDKYEFLCPDGSKQDLKDADICPWACRPHKAFVVSSTMQKDKVEKIKAELEKLHTKGNSDEETYRWYKTVLHGDDGDYLHHLANPVPVNDYNDKCNFTQVMDRPYCKSNPEKNLRWCVTDDIEAEKCDRMKMAATSNRIVPQISCVKSDSKLDCMEKMNKNEADATVVDSALIHSHGKKMNIVPVASEEYGMGKHIFAVAMVKASESDIVDVISMKGKKSCHSSIDTYAGWFAPVYELISDGLIKNEVCDLEDQVAEFFAASCIPGAKNSKLCSLCVGSESGDNVCKPNYFERYYNDEGAVQCLADGKGDIAFVKHSYILAHPEAAEEFKLVCPEGGHMQLTDYRACNFGVMLENKVVTSGKKIKGEKESIQSAVLDMSFFANYYTNSFKMGEKGGIFSVGVTHLSPDQPDYRDLVEKVAQCTKQ